MTRTRIAIVVALLVLAGVVGTRLLQARSQATAAAAAAASGAASATASQAGQANQGGPTGRSGATGALELAPDDLLALAPHELSRGVAVSGSLKAVNSAVLKAKVAGELLELLPREGDSVVAGQLLGRIDAGDAELRLQQAEHNMAAAQAQLDLARRQLDNNRALVGQGYISTTALDASVANDNGARASLQAAQSGVDIARKAVGDTRLVAPIAGQVAQRLAQPGERLAVDARVIEIVDLTRLELEAALPPEDAGALRSGAAARLEVEGVTGPVAARIARINPVAQAGTRAVLVYLALQPGPGQAGALRGGLFARGAVELARARVPALPLGAVHVDEAQPYVLVFEPSAGATSPAGRPSGASTSTSTSASASADASASSGAMSLAAQAPDRGTLVRRSVVLGERGSERSIERGTGLASNEEWVEIRSGLTPGARVLRGSVGSVPSGTPARLGVAGAASRSLAGAAGLAPAAAAATATTAR